MKTVKLELTLKEFDFLRWEVLENADDPYGSSRDKMLYDLQEKLDTIYESWTPKQKTLYHEVTENK